MRKRLQYFDMCVTPVVLYALSCFPLTISKLDDLDRLQRRMLRRIVGWRRIDGEAWEDTMRRMKQRLDNADRLYHCRPWSMSFARSQWRFVDHLLHGDISLWSRILCKYNWSPVYDEYAMATPQRRPGHPRMRWDDHIHAFCTFLWPQLQDRRWFDILVHHDLFQYEKAFVAFLRHAPV